MVPENNITPEETTLVAETTAASAPKTSTSEGASSNHGERKFSKDRRNDKGGRRDRGEKKDKPKKEFDELLLEVRRVTRVTTGGRRMSFRATILVGNKKGKIWLGISKGNDVAGAVSKATNEAYKTMFEVPITKGDTVPYALTYKYKSANVRLLPASAGTGLKAGSSIRSVLELAGYANILSKMIGSNNKLNNALATIQALASYKHADYFSELREVKEETPVAAAKAKEVENSEGNIETANHSSKKSVTSSKSPEKEAVASGEKKSAVKKWNETKSHWKVKVPVKKTTKPEA